MSDLRELYQEVIIDHAKRPRNFGKLVGATQKAEGMNPLCGDRITIYTEVESGRVQDLRFEGSGCAVSTASASMMTDFLKGKTVDEVQAAFVLFHDLLTGKLPSDEAMDSLGKLAVFAGVCEFPARVKCATLAWHSVRAALEGRGEPISTE